MTEKYCCKCSNCRTFIVATPDKWRCMEFPIVDAVHGISTYETCYEIQRRMDNNCNRFKDKDAIE